MTIEHRRQERNDGQLLIIRVKEKDTSFYYYELKRIDIKEKNLK